MKRQSKSLILNSPYAEPQEYWRYDRERREFSRERGRRQAGYLQATPQSKDFDDPGVFVPIPLANEIRKRVGRWRAAGYPGVSGMTRRLLAYWSEREAEDMRFFFCQLEAAETLIWLTEGLQLARAGLGKRGANQKQEERGQARRKERPGLYR